MARLAYRNRCEYFFFTSLRLSISPNFSWYFSASGLVSYRCSGSVISNRYVLTAAHCVTNLIDELDLWVFVLYLRFYRSFCLISMWNVFLLSRRLYVRLGELDVHRNLCDNNHALCSEPQDFEIESVIHHQAYDSPKYSHDIALIRLRVATNSSKWLPSLLSFFFFFMHSLHLGFISPLCLPVGQYAHADQNLGGKMGIVAGWAASTFRSASESASLQWLRLPITDTQKCAHTYARFSANSRSPIIITENQLCVQGRTNQDACQGKHCNHCLGFCWKDFTNLAACMFRRQRWTIDERQQREWTVHVDWTGIIRSENVRCFELSWCLHQSCILHRLDNKKYALNFFRQYIQFKLWFWWNSNLIIFFVSKRFSS